MRRVLLIAGLAVVLTTLGALPVYAGENVQLTPVGRLPFPEKGYVVDLASNVSVGHIRVDLRENGQPVNGVRVTPVSATDLSVGTVLAVDASESMHGAPSSAALNAAREFVDERSAHQQIGLVAFNSGINVLLAPSSSVPALHAALARPTSLAYGTRIYDALSRSLGLLAAASVSEGSIVLLSDGTDIGSHSTLNAVVTRAVKDHIRIFTIGLRSKTFDPTALKQLASRTNGTYAEAGSASQLASIYSGLGGRLASEYVLQYRSKAKTGETVQVAVDVAGHGTGTASYVAPAPAVFQPYHQSSLARFFLSGTSLAVMTLLIAALAAAVILLLFRRPEATLVDRVGEFVAIGGKAPRPARPVRATRRPALGAEAVGSWRAKLENDFDVGGIAIRPQVFIVTTVLVTILAFILLATVSIPLALLAVLVPVFARSWVTSKVKRVRDAFGNQLPDTLQLLASALRSGHSFMGAMSVVVDRAPQPIRGEFRQILTDDQLGLPMEDALRRTGKRMENRDMEQVALLSELQRAAGGNSAEVLDLVVETVRERADVRRLAQTLTAQGRLARWILTFMPLGIGLFLLLTEHGLMRPLYATGIGQFFLVAAALMVVAGSFWIKKIVEIKV